MRKTKQSKIMVNSSTEVHSEISSFISSPVFIPRVSITASFCFGLVWVLGFELRTSCMLDKGSTVELHSSSGMLDFMLCSLSERLFSPLMVYLLSFARRTWYPARASATLAIFSIVYTSTLVLETGFHIPRLPPNLLYS